MLGETAAYNLEVFCLRKAPQLKQLLQKYGYNAPVNPDTLQYALMLQKEPFIDDLCAIVSSGFNDMKEEKLLAAFDGTNVNPEEMEKTKLQEFIDKMAGIANGVNSIVNPDKPEEPKKDDDDNTILGMKPFWFYTLVLVIVIIAIALILYYN